VLEVSILMDQLGLTSLKGEPVAMVPYGKKLLPHVEAFVKRNLRVRKIVNESGAINVFEQAPTLARDASLHNHIVVSIEYPESRLAPQI
jgi:hypothetical protein